MTFSLLGGGGTRDCRGKPGRAQQHVKEAYRRTLYRASMRPIRRVLRAARSPTGQGSAEPRPCARESKAQTGTFLTGKMIDHGMCSSFKGQQGAVNRRDSWGAFQGCTGLWTAGCWLARRHHEHNASTAPRTSMLEFSYYPHDVWP